MGAALREKLNINGKAVPAVDEPAPAAVAEPEIAAAAAVGKLWNGPST